MIKLFRKLNSLALGAEPTRFRVPDRRVEKEAHMYKTQSISSGLLEVTPKSKPQAIGN